MKIHVLHIGKTGGTAIRHALASFANRNLFALHSHAVRLRDCPEDELVFVVIRHPVDRFVSGFNSRLRQGRPRYDVPWSRRERLAFALFPSPNHLAEAIGSRNLLFRIAAFWAMNSIIHVNSRLSYWLESSDYVSSRGSLLISRVETLDDDMERLFARAGIAQRIVLPSNPKDAHASPVGMSSTISAQGRANLDAWLKDDIALYEHCLTLAR